ncbi:MAG: AAA family ATPase [Bacteroidales bacterium]|jgi:predicted ATPase|nr:AAA family ATPase [Bacteroidales bacterium]
MDKIEVKGFKSIKDLSIELRPINILIGSNGSGKSNFLSFFDFLQMLNKPKFKEYVALNGGAEKFLHKGSKITEEIKIKIDFDSKDAYSFTLKKLEDYFIFTEENLYGEGCSDLFGNNKDITSFSERSNLLKLKNRHREYLAQIRKYHFHDTSKNSPFARSSSINNGKFELYGDGRNIAAFLYNIQQEKPKHYNLIVKTIQSIAPYFSNFIFKPEGENIILRWENKYSDTIYGVNDLSDGTMRFIALATLFMQPNLPQSIIIDEPELGLHPDAIAKLSGMIKSVAAQDCQVIIATQSTDLISYFEPEDILTVDNIDGESKFKRLDKKELETWLEDYTIGDLWKRNIISTGQPN